jgi:hypothetical protein
VRGLLLFALSLHWLLCNHDVNSGLRRFAYAILAIHCKLDQECSYKLLASKKLMQVSSVTGCKFMQMWALTFHLQRKRGEGDRECAFQNICLAAVASV